MQRFLMLGLSVLLVATAAPVLAQTAPEATSAPTFDERVAATLVFAEEQLRDTVADLPDSTTFPRSTDVTGGWSTVSASDWTSGFFPALLWQMYLHTGDSDFLTWATSWSSSLPGQATRTDTHDLGFMVGLPAGLAFEATGDTGYRDTIVTAAESLASRFDPDVGATRSWDFGSWQFPVIIDNMMNLELLRDGADLTTSPTDAASWDAMAVSHATVTGNEHVRGNGTTYHVIDFDPTNGTVLSRETHQGAGDETTWARGQAWGLYGFTLMHRETGDAATLATAQELADFFVGSLPADSIPYWDFEAPGIPSAPRDTSAAAIAASGLLELSTLTTGTASDSYLGAAAAILDSLMSPAYLSDGGSSDGILLHGVGNHPSSSEIDVSLIYGDYYLVEALLRYLDIDSPVNIPPAESGTFIDDDGSVFETDIEWMAAEGITKGCNPPANTMFCPASSVTRGQMAAFLDRALTLPATGTDFFTDDNGSTFEDNINRVAAVGITLGCGNGMYCPTSTVTRGQMAAFLARALSLTTQLDNPFTDDDGSIFEDDIEKIAAAGITLGCGLPGNGLYCPTGLVTRGQMAAFLHRALS